MVITSYIASPQHNIINIVIHILSFSLILNFDIVLKCQYFFKKIKKAMINIIKNRCEEDGIKYAYIGQSLHVWTRLAEHLAGYQHIDLSLKKHGFYSIDNPTGYNVWQIFCAKDKLDEKEQFYIKKYANAGYQLRNHTTGSQGVGKRGIDAKPSRGYYDGKQQGRDDLIKEVQRLLKYVDVAPKGGRLSERMYQKFIALFSPKGIDIGEE